MPLITWCFVLADDPTAAQQKLNEKKQVHPDNVLKITREVLL